MRPITGDQYPLERHAGGRTVRATVTQLAACLRGLSVDGVDLVEPWGEDRLAPMGSGLVLVPWPNRIKDGLWLLDGHEQQLDITEPGYSNASHGLLRNTGYTLVDHTGDAVTLSATVFPQHGWPFLLDTGVTYRLVDDGIEVTHRIRNDSAKPAPAAIGAHPYLKIGDVPTSDLLVTVAADTYFETDHQLIPFAEHSVDGTEFDLRGERRVAELNLNVGLGGVRIEDGVSRHSVTAPDGRRVELWAGPDFGFLQLYTPTAFPTLSGPDHAIAIEPMTAPANAFNSGQGLRWLQPGEEWTATWGIRYVLPAD
jgi:aldose 1-epimerase